MQRWTIQPIHAGACELLDAQGLHVGNLKLIQGQWKFKAIGHDAQGQLIPGGGPLTDRHNTVLGRLDDAALCAALGPPDADASALAAPQTPPALQFLVFELGLVAEGLSTLEAMASTPRERHAAVMTEVQQVLDWAWRHFAQGHGPVDEGHEWDHHLQVTTEAGGWQVVTLTLTGSDRFVDAFSARFGPPQD